MVPGFGKAVSTSHNSFSNSSVDIPVDELQEPVQLVFPSHLILPEQAYKQYHLNFSKNFERVSQISENTTSSLVARWHQR